MGVPPLSTDKVAVWSNWNPLTMTGTISRAAGLIRMCVPCARSEIVSGLGGESSPWLMILSALRNKLLLTPRTNVRFPCRPVMVTWRLFPKRRKLSPFA